MHPTIKDRIRLERVCRQAKFDKDVSWRFYNINKLYNVPNNITEIYCEGSDVEPSDQDSQRQ